MVNGEYRISLSVVRSAVDLQNIVTVFCHKLGNTIIKISVLHFCSSASCENPNSRDCYDVLSILLTVLDQKV